MVNCYRVWSLVKHHTNPRHLASIGRHAARHVAAHPVVWASTVVCVGVAGLLPALAPRVIPPGRVPVEQPQAADQGIGGTGGPDTVPPPSYGWARAPGTVPEAWYGETPPDWRYPSAPLVTPALPQTEETIDIRQVIPAADTVPPTIDVPEPAGLAVLAVPVGVLGWVRRKV